MRMINRLIEPTSGQIFIDGQDVTKSDEVKLRRGIGYVIQQIGLFPHQKIIRNVMTVPLLYGESTSHARDRARQLLDLVGLDPDTYGDRYPHQLSGGQRQRVGVARALAADPPVLLMDEPFGAVDPIVRIRLQDEFLKIQRELGKTVVLVTHDIDEAVKMGDRIAILTRRSHIEQYDTPETILAAPANDFVRDFIGSGALLKRLDLTRLGDVGLAPADGGRSPATIGLGATLRDALEALVASGGRPVAVTDGDGDVVGTVDLATVTAAVEAMRNGTVAEGD
jgi:osmoprotectant transport system ATP-binding protein